MTQDEVLKMAKQAGFSSAVGKHIALDDDLERFAKLVAQHEREACAKVAENTKAPFTATAIRARGQALDYEPWTPDDMAYRPDGLPQRTWVGLTDKEAAECWTYNDRTSWKNIEAKLRSKNNG
jgi:hypothetical protein